MARTNKSRFAILGCLSIGPMSAYDIKQFISGSVAHFWSEGEGQLYPTLRRLDNENLVDYQEEEATKGGIKKIYSITKKGKSALSDWLEKKTERSVYRNELLLKIFFGSNQTTAANIHLLEEGKCDCKATLDILLSIQQSCKEKSLPKKRKPYIEMSLDYGIEVLRAEVNWFRRSLKKLQKL